MNAMLDTFSPKNPHVPPHLAAANEAAAEYVAQRGPAVHPQDAEKVRQGGKFWVLHMSNQRHGFCSSQSCDSFDQLCRYVFRNLMRDWSEEGAAEREQSYGRIVAELRRLLGEWRGEGYSGGEGGVSDCGGREGDVGTAMVGSSSTTAPLGDGQAAGSITIDGKGGSIGWRRDLQMQEQGRQPRVLVPGAGLGRLCLEIVSLVSPPALPHPPCRSTFFLCWMDVCIWSISIWPILVEQHTSSQLPSQNIGLHQPAVMSFLPPHRKQPLTHSAGLRGDRQRVQLLHAAHLGLRAQLHGGREAVGATPLAPLCGEPPVRWGSAAGDSCAGCSSCGGCRGRWDYDMC